jgi:hypothetical protein
MWRELSIHLLIIEQLLDTNPPRNSYAVDGVGVNLMVSPTKRHQYIAES